MTADSPGRREVHYSSLAQVLDDAENAAARNAPTMGEWTLGQIFEHIATVMEKSIDGFDSQVAWPVRLAARHVMKRRILRNGMPPGIRLTGEMADELLPRETTVEEGLSHLRRAIGRMQVETPRAPHPAFGPMEGDEATEMQLRHAELHMSFVAGPTA